MFDPGTKTDRQALPLLDDPGEGLAHEEFTDRLRLRRWAKAWLDETEGYRERIRPEPIEAA